MAEIEYEDELECEDDWERLNDCGQGEASRRRQDFVFLWDRTIVFAPDL